MDVFLGEQMKYIGGPQFGCDLFCLQRVVHAGCNVG